mmetsp:Transcript_74686/g.118145  ORF Transcript_74686/g.118145 Transcript_74686/m.118145 type:complete len:211 (-) Transcript_74686:1772-2404(-)
MLLCLASLSSASVFSRTLCNSAPYARCRKECKEETPELCEPAEDAEGAALFVSSSCTCVSSTACAASSVCPSSTSIIPLCRAMRSVGYNNATLWKSERLNVTSLLSSTALAPISCLISKRTSMSPIISPVRAVSRKVAPCRSTKDTRPRYNTKMRDAGSPTDASKLPLPTWMTLQHVPISTKKFVEQCLNASDFSKYGVKARRAIFCFRM